MSMTWRARFAAGPTPLTLSILALRRPATMKALSSVSRNCSLTAKALAMDAVVTLLWEGRSEQALDRDQSMTYIQCECLSRRAEEEQDAEEEEEEDAEEEEGEQG